MELLGWVSTSSSGLYEDLGLFEGPYAPHCNLYDCCHIFRSPPMLEEVVEVFRE